MDHVRQLLTKHRPGVSIRQVEKDHGLSPNLLGYWLKPGSHVVRIPSVPTLIEIARALDCAPEILFVAFALDLGYPVPEADRKAFARAVASRSRR